MSHLNWSRVGVRSTKSQSNLLPEDTENDLKPLLGKKNWDMYFKIIDMWDPEYKIYPGQTGKFLVQSRAGNWYIIIIIKIDSNCVLVQLTNNKSEKNGRHLQGIDEVTPTGRHSCRETFPQQWMLRELEENDPQHLQIGTRASRLPLTHHCRGGHQSIQIMVCCAKYVRTNSVGRA